LIFCSNLLTIFRLLDQNFKDQNVEVVGAEFSTLAISNFFTENNLNFEVRKFSETSSSYHCCDKNLSILQGDFFEMIIGFENYDFIWDRAAMIAINPCDRAKYAAKLNSLLTVDGTILLEAVHREEGRTGPPHTLTEQNLVEVFEPLGFAIEHLEHHEYISDRLGKLEVHHYFIKRTWRKMEEMQDILPEDIILPEISLS